MNIKNAVFLITGGSSGIGKAIAEELTKKGGNIAITGRDKEKLEKVAGKIGALAIEADVSKDEDIDRTYRLVMEKFGKLDCLVNNAGIGKRSPLDTIERSDMKVVYEVNVFGAALMAKKAAEIFKNQQYGHLINIGSTAALKGYAGGSIYAASKFALRGMTECWRHELRKHNVRVMLVNPSEVTTAFGDPERKERKEIPKKLRSVEIAHAVVCALEMDDRGFIPEYSVWATNPF